MEIDEYMVRAMQTALPSALNMQYMGFNLVAEVGELLGHEAKAVRDTDGILSEERERLQRKEAGDAFWQLIGICFVKGWVPSEILGENLDKLKSRQERGTIGGSGDER